MEKKLLQSIEEMTADVDAVQERVLAEILARNADAEYLARCGLAGGGGATDRATFRAKVPMVTYDDLKPYILRVVNGDTSPVLTGSGHPISEFFVSSGTSGGERKLIPAVKDEFQRRYQLHIRVMPVIKQYVSGLDGGSALFFHFVKPETTTPGGLPARTLTTSFLNSHLFKNLPYDPHRGLTSPAAAVLCIDTSQSMYAQMLCGLRYRDAVVRVGAAFAYGLVRAVSFLQQNWRQLANDIEAGALAPCVTDTAVREAVAGVLGPADPELARFIRTECARAEARGGDGWAGIIERVWPNAKYLDTIATGSMAQYVPTLDYYSGGLPIVSTFYGASECHFGLNLQPMSKPSEVAYTIMPSMAYFEFLPVDAGADATASQLVELANVEAGREYEVVVTTYAGLCRYRVGDVLRVVGFHNAAPRVQFVRRGNVVLSIDTDKTDEAELQRAVELASAALLLPRGVAVFDYTSRTCTDLVPGHYVVYWELLATDKAADGGGGALELDRCCLEMEEALSSVYREARVAHGTIGPLEIRVVRPGTFEELADYAVAHGASVGQYKVPRRVTAPGMIELLDSRVVSSHFSPALPHWAPRRRFE